jgi:hypothetical protein
LQDEDEVVNAKQLDQSDRRRGFREREREREREQRKIVVGYFNLNFVPFVDQNRLGKTAESDRKGKKIAPDKVKLKVNEVKLIYICMTCRANLVNIHVHYKCAGSRLVL